MACLRTVVYVTLLCAVASAVEIKRPPQDGVTNYQDYHGDHNPNQIESYDPAKEPYHGGNNPNSQANKEDRKIFKPYFYHPYFYHPLVHQPDPAPETPETVEVFDSTEAQPEDQEVTDSVNEEEEPESETQTDEAVPYDYVSRMEPRKSYKVACDYLTVAKYSCYTCHTYLVCKPEGGKVKSCSEPNALYCNNGGCSSTPSAECALNSSAVFY